MWCERNNRGCYGNTCCTLVVWAFYWYMVVIALETWSRIYRHFTSLLIKNPTVKGLSWNYTLKPIPYLLGTQDRKVDGLEPRAVLTLDNLLWTTVRLLMDQGVMEARYKSFAKLIDPRKSWRKIFISIYWNSWPTWMTLISFIQQRRHTALKAFVLDPNLLHQL